MDRMEELMDGVEASGFGPWAGISGLLSPLSLCSPVYAARTSASRSFHSSIWLLKRYFRYPFVIPHLISLQTFSHCR